MARETYSVRNPLGDAGRLAAVARSGLIGTEPESAFDDLTRIAAIVVGVPLAFVTVVDEIESYWKSAFGTGTGSANRCTVDESFCQYVVSSEREVIISDARADRRSHKNPSVEAMGLRAWLGFPLLAPGGEVLGSFCIADLVTREWSSRDIEVVETLAAAASREIALREAVRTAREARARAESLARALQSSLLPPVSPSIAGLDVGARFHSAGSGSDLVGDFYDVFAAEPPTWRLLLGDVCGKGIEAATLAAFARNSVSTIAMNQSSPAIVLENLNATLNARSPAPERFLSAVFATLEVNAHACKVRFARAGHPAPIVRRANGEVSFLEPAGDLLGIQTAVAFDEEAFELGPGDLFVVYTDGVEEARRGRGEPIFGLDRLAALIRTFDASLEARALAERIEEEVLAFSGGTAGDDIAIVVIRMPVA